MEQIHHLQGNGYNSSNSDLQIKPTNDHNIYNFNSIDLTHVKAKI